LFLLDLGGVAAGEPTAYPEPIGTSRKIQATRIDISIEDIIRAEGPRVPPSDACHWKGGVVLVYTPQAPPSDAVISKLVAYANRFESFYEWATDHRGSFDLTKDGRGFGTVQCPAPGTGLGEDASARSEDGGSDSSGLPADIQEDIGPSWWDFGPPPETIHLGETKEASQSSIPDSDTQSHDILSVSDNAGRVSNGASKGAGCSAGLAPSDLLCLLAVAILLFQCKRARRPA